MDGMKKTMDCLLPSRYCGMEQRPSMGLLGGGSNLSRVREKCKKAAEERKTPPKSIRRRAWNLSNDKTQKAERKAVAF